MDPKFKRIKAACYISNICGAMVCNLSPLLFLTFRSMYGISYSLLGLLIAINFFTQLGIDLIFSFFSHKFNIPKTVKAMPILTTAGFLIYAIYPFIFPNSVYVGLLVGTFLFSISGGLGEVLISPLIAAIPSKDPDREMSLLHSLYAWGVVGIIIISSIFLYMFGTHNWQWLTLILTSIPVVAALLYADSEFPQVVTPKKTSGAIAYMKKHGVWLCVIAIFLGGASELVMAQWSSTYLERAPGIPKVWGDIFGVALFGFTLGIGRSMYAKIGKNISRVLVSGAVGATICYLLAAISENPFIGLTSCALTGLCVSMMWPGSLIVSSDRYPYGGVLIYALMAAGGDFGASVGPQIVGIITDFCMSNQSVLILAQSINMAPENLGMRIGLLIGALFPLAAIPVYMAVKKMRNE